MRVLWYVSGSSVVASSPSKALAAIPEEGTEAPDFILPSSEGKDVSLKDLTNTGKTTVLYFYPASFTKGTGA